MILLVYSPEWSSDQALGNGISAWRPKNDDPAPWISIKLKEKYRIQAIQGKILIISTVSSKITSSYLLSVIITSGNSRTLISTSGQSNQVRVQVEKFKL